MANQQLGTSIQTLLKVFIPKSKTHWARLRGSGFSTSKSADQALGDDLPTSACEGGSDGPGGVRSPSVPTHPTSSLCSFLSNPASTTQGRTVVGDPPSEGDRMQPGTHA